MPPPRGDIPELGSLHAPSYLLCAVLGWLISWLAGCSQRLCFFFPCWSSARVVTVTRLRTRAAWTYRVATAPSAASPWPLLLACGLGGVHCGLGVSIGGRWRLVSRCRCRGGARTHAASTHRRVGALRGPSAGARRQLERQHLEPSTVPVELLRCRGRRTGSRVDRGCDSSESSAAALACTTCRQEIGYPDSGAGATHCTGRR